MELMFGRVQFPVLRVLMILVTHCLGKIFRGVAETIKAEAKTATEEYDDVVMEEFRPVNGTGML